MEQKDIRWEQRFSNFRKALFKLSQAAVYIKENVIKPDGSENRVHYNEDEEVMMLENDMFKESLIQRFEYTHELAWNVMKDYAHYQGNFEIKGSRDSIREAFKMGLISDGSVWMSMISSRNMTTHTYNEDTAESICSLIISRYLPAFAEFEAAMEKLRTGKQKDLFD